MGALIGAGFAIDRLMSGDYTGAGLELTSGVLGGLGLTPLSIATDVGIAARDIKNAKDSASKLTDQIDETTNNYIEAQKKNELEQTKRSYIEMKIAQYQEKDSKRPTEENTASLLKFTTQLEKLTEKEEKAKNNINTLQHDSKKENEPISLKNENTLAFMYQKLESKLDTLIAVTAQGLGSVANATAQGSNGVMQAVASSGGSKQSSGSGGNEIAALRARAHAWINVG